MNHLQDLCSNSGSVMRFDHTYKSTKSLGVIHQQENKATRIQLKSSTLVVMNKRGEVLDARIVPLDQHEHIKNCFTEIIQTKGKKADTLPTAIFTDNVAQDSKALKMLY